MTDLSDSFSSKIKEQIGIDRDADLFASGQRQSRLTSRENGTAIAQRQTQFSDRTRKAC